MEVRMRLPAPSRLVPLVLSGWLIFSANAQEFRATLQGVVTDATHAVVPGASVTLWNIKTGVQSVRLTNETGRYRFDFVDPGSYTVSVAAAGFAKFVQENIEVQALADITVDAALRTGDMRETVTVMESPVAVNFNSTNVGLTVDTKLATELPRLDRNPFKLDLLNPAVQDTRRQEM